MKPLKDETKLFLKSVMKSEEISTLDKYALIANIAIVDELITQTLDFVEFLFKLIKEEKIK